MRKRQKAVQILERLGKVIPVPETELQYQSPFQLLVAVVLSAQCTDKRVNLTTPALFERFPTPADLAASDFDEVFSYIKSISFPANKSRHLIQLAQILESTYQGEVPRDYDALLSLPGVGRKTANVVTSVIWHEPRMAVDTHVFRVAARLGLSFRAKTPLQTEMQLIALLKPHEIPDAHHYLILLGRYTCTARNPSCDTCVLTDLCTWYKRRNPVKATPV
jgi:endonuclease III